MSFVLQCQELAASAPEAPAFIYLVDGGAERVLSRGELDQRARAVAEALIARGLRGKRVLLLHVPGLEFVVALLGCMYAGAIAVPAYPPEPGRLARTLPRLQAILNDCAPALVLTTQELLAMVPFAFNLAPDLATVPWEASEQWQTPSGAGAPLPAPALEDLAFLQYTSGSTSTPKGVMIGHAELSAHFEQGREHFKWERPTLVSWLPFYHDMGLIGGILFPLWVGARVVLMSPLDFLKRPACWLQAIDKYRGEISMAPPFALDLCVRKLQQSDLRGLDLSCWRALAIGAEPIHRATLDRFAALLRPCGFQRAAMVPSYGLAETILMVSDDPRAGGLGSSPFSAAAMREGRVVPATSDADAKVLVSSGQPLPRTRIEIVDPATSRRCAPDRVGEIWIQAASVASGYWNRPAETAATFGARLADSDDGPFLRTGDLGFVSDGALYIVSRLKDLIIIRGKNHHPQDIEQTVLPSHPLLRPGSCAAFSIDEGSGEQLVIVAEVNTRELPAGGARQDTLQQIGQAIARAVTQQHALTVHTVALLEPGQLPKTSSGKIMRQPARADFLAGRLVEVARFAQARNQAPAGEGAAEALPAAPASRSPAALATWLSSWLTQRLQLAPQTLTADLPLVTLGIDSKDAVTIAGELTSALGQSLPAAALYEYPSVAALAAYLATPAASVAAAADPSRTTRCAVPLSPGSQRPVFFVPGIFGVLTAFSHLAHELSAQLPIWGLALPVHRQLPAPANVAQLAERYVDELLATADAAPYRLVGYCSGGMVALEMCRQLRQRGQQIEKLVLLDAPYLGAARTDLAQLQQAANLQGQPTLEQAVRRVVQHIVGQQWSFGEGADLVEQMVVGGTANLRLFQGYEPRPLAISATLVSAHERVRFPLYDEDSARNAARWSALFGGSISLRTAPGNHHSMLQPPQVAELAQLLLSELTRPPATDQVQ